MLISLKDCAKGEFTAPMLVASDDEAKRTMIMLFMNGQDSMVTRFPSQFQLYDVGDFTISDGILTPTAPRFIIDGLTAKNEAIKTIQSSQLEVAHAD